MCTHWRVPNRQNHEDLIFYRGVGSHQDNFGFPDLWDIRKFDLPVKTESIFPGSCMKISIRSSSFLTPGIKNRKKLFMVIFAAV